MSLGEKGQVISCRSVCFRNEPAKCCTRGIRVLPTLLSVWVKNPTDAMISWILSHDISMEKYPQGLYIGLSGIAWVFWGLGMRKLAFKIDEDDIRAIHCCGMNPVYLLWCGGVRFSVSVFPQGNWGYLLVRASDTCWGPTHQG